MPQFSQRHLALFAALLIGWEGVSMGISIYFSHLDGKKWHEGNAHWSEKMFSIMDPIVALVNLVNIGFVVYQYRASASGKAVTSSLLYIPLGLLCGVSIYSAFQFIVDCVLVQGTSTHTTAADVLADVVEVWLSISNGIMYWWLANITPLKYENVE